LHIEFGPRKGGELDSIAKQSFRADLDGGRRKKGAAKIFPGGQGPGKDCSPHCFGKGMRPGGAVWYGLRGHDGGAAGGSATLGGRSALSLYTADKFSSGAKRAFRPNGAFSASGRGRVTSDTRWFFGGLESLSKGGGGGGGGQWARPAGFGTETKEKNQFVRPFKKEGGWVIVHPREMVWPAGRGGKCWMRFSR